MTNIPSHSLKGSINTTIAVKGSVNAGTVIKGDRGDDGATFTPVIDESGNLSWSNNANLDNPITINIMGPIGPKGEKGDTGNAGPKGDKGDSGYTPVKGVDYFTDEDKTELINTILASLPNASDISILIENDMLKVSKQPQTVAPHMLKETAP